MSRPPVGNDNSLPPEENASKSSFWDDITMGLRFFSRLPTGNSPHKTPQMSRIARTLGVTSLAIGVVSAGIYFNAILIGMQPLLAAGFAVAAQIFVTGAMAEDGLADSFDGLWGGHTPDQRLEIMKDSTHGTYGVLALVMLTLLRVSALATLIGHFHIGAVLLWLGAQIIARQSALWLMVALPSARAEGVAVSTGALSKKPFTVGAIIAALLAGPLIGFYAGLLSLIITAAFVVLIVYIWSRICKQKLGGYSGDVIGALQALVEIGALTTFIVVS